MLVAIATRPDSMNRAGKPVTVHAFPRATVIGMTLLPRSPKPSSAPGNLSHLMRTRFARADVAGNDDAGCTRYQTPA